MALFTKLGNVLGEFIDNKKYDCQNAKTKWFFDEDTGTLTISGIGEMDKYMPHRIYPPWYSYKKLIKKVIIKNGITTIGSSAFMDFENLEEVTIPDSVGVIGMWAFKGCMNLLKISSNAWWIGDKSFLNCTNLQSVEMNRVIRIGKRAFKNCSNLKEINFMNLNEIEDHAFENCKKISYFNIKQPDKIAKSAFYGCLFLEKDIPMMIKEKDEIKQKMEEERRRLIAQEEFKKKEKERKRMEKEAKEADEKRRRRKNRR